MNTLQDRIRGSLIGGAIGDALGYPVEFIYSFEEIQQRYGYEDIPQFFKDDLELHDVILHMADDLYRREVSNFQ